MHSSHRSWSSSQRRSKPAKKEKRDVGDTAAGADLAENYTVSIGSLIDTKVRDRDGKELGNLKRIMVDPKSGQIESAVVSVGGGMLGLKEEQVISVPWEHVAIRRNKDGMFVSLEREVVEKVQEPKTARQERANETAEREKADRPRISQKSASESSKSQQAGETVVREQGAGQKDQQGGYDLDPTGPKQSHDENTVRKAQQALKEKGFDPGPVNGVMGDETREALKEFQKANGLSATGMLDEKTKKELGIEASAGSSKPEAQTSKSDKKSHEPSSGGKTM